MVDLASILVWLLFRIFSFSHKLIDIFLKISALGMSSVDDFTFLVNKSDEWNTLVVPNVGTVVTNLEMLRLSPSFVNNVVDSSL